MGGLALCALYILLGPAASPDEERRAKESFEEGVRHLEARRLPQAREAFQRSLVYQRSSSALYNLALVERDLDLLVEAEVNARLLLAHLAETGKGGPTLERGQRLLAELGAQLGTLILRTEGQGVMVSLDERPLGPPGGPLTVRVRAGPHRVALHEGVALLAEQEVVVPPGEVREVALAPPLRAPPPAPAAPAPPPARTAEPPPAPMAPSPAPQAFYEAWWFWAGVVGLVAAGAVVGVLAVDDGQTCHVAPSSGVCLNQR